MNELNKIKEYGINNNREVRLKLTSVKITEEEILINLNAQELIDNE